MRQARRGRTSRRIEHSRGIPLWIGVIVLALSPGALPRAEDFDDGERPAPVEGMAGSADVPMYAEYAKKLKEHEQLQPLTSELFGDGVSLYTGQASFSVVDIDLPGNSALPVQLRRTLDVSLLSEQKTWDPLGSPTSPYTGLGNWAIDVPQIHGVFDAQYKWNRPAGSPAGTIVPRCLQYFLPGVPNPSQFSLSEVASGISIHIPGVGDKSLLIKDPTATPLPPYPSTQGAWTTKDFDRITCKETKNGGGQGFVLTTTDGVSYAFDWYVERFESTLSKDGVFSSDGITYYNPRVSIHLLATEVSDRHGNWVKYTYSAADDGYPSVIESSDGRKIELTYENAYFQDNGQKRNRRLASAKVQLSQVGGMMAPQTRTWTYAYLAPDGAETSRLSSVTLPGGSSSWKYSYIGDSYVRFEVNDDSNLPCPKTEVSPSNKTFGLKMEHPAGAIGEFSFKYERQERALGDAACGQYNQHGLDDYVDYLKLESKRVYHSAAKSDLWEYETGLADFGCGRNCDVSKSRVILPDGGVVQYEFSRRYDAMSVSGVAEGRLLSTSHYLSAESLKNGETPLRSEVNTYVRGPNTGGEPLSGYSFPARYGIVLLGDPATGSLRPLQKVAITQQGKTFTRTYTEFDAYGRPTKVTRQGPGGKRDEETAYSDNTAKWVLGQVLSIKDVTPSAESSANESFGGTIVRNTYDPAWADLLSVSEYGRVVRTMTYRVGPGEDGTLKTIQDGANHTTTLGTFHRGIPTSVTYADGSSQSAVIDDAGSIRSVTDEVGATTAYDYDAMGRMTKITYPTEDGEVWNETVIAYAQTEAGTSTQKIKLWKQTATTGDTTPGNTKRIKIVAYDGRLRPMSTTEYDGTTTTTTNATRRVVERRYDHANRETFVSYPRAAEASFTDEGTWTTYDPLGRITRVRQSTGAGTAQDTVTEYLADFKTRVTDPRGYSTTTGYQAFDAPSEEAPTTIEMPEGVSVSIARDRFGNPVTVTRSGTYNGAALSAVRSYAYDSNLRLCATTEPESGTTVQAYDAAGNVSWIAKGTAVSGCNRGAVASTDKATFGYDARNRVTTVTYPGGAASITKAYWPDGALRTATSAGATWTYGYNNRRLLVSESLQYDGETFLLGRSYDKNGSLMQVMYPDDTIVAYGPNALGQPTRAGDYATNVTYHPNGAMKGFTYGNAIAHSLTLDGRQLPLRSKDGTVTDLEYAYDASANVSSITDKRSPSIETRTMTYDGLNRLLTANAPGMWGNGTFTYDALDNLRTSTVGIRSCTHAYDGVKNRLTSISGTNCPTLSYGHDARGNVTQRGTQALEFDRADRLTAATGTEKYTYDAHGRRVRVERASDGSKLYQVYGLDGQLLYGLDTATGKSTDYVYLNGSLVARLGEGSSGGGDPGVPEVPEAPMVTPPVSTTGTYAVSWAPVAGATSYVLLESQNGGSFVPAPGSAMPWSPDAPRPSGRYAYQVRACNANGCSVAGPAASAIVIRAPEDFKATPNPVTEGAPYTVSWRAVPTATAYRLEEQVGGNWVSRSDDLATSYSAGIRPLGSYIYRVAACHETVCTDGSAPLTVTVGSAPPCQPTGLTAPATNTTGTYTVSWTSCGAAHYLVQERYNAGAWSDPPKKVEGTAWSPDPKEHSGTYDYQVAGCNSSNQCSAYTSPASVAVTVPNDTPPQIPAAPTLTPGLSMDGWYSVSWTAVTGAARYELYESRYGGSQVRVYSGPNLSWPLPAAKDNATYQYRLSACNTHVCSALGPSAGVRVMKTPTNLRSSRNPVPSGTAYAVSWDSVPTANGYDLEEKIGTGAWSRIATQMVQSGMDMGQRPVGTYQYRVRSCLSSTVCTAYSPAYAVTVSAVVPAQPEWVRATPTSSTDGHYTVSWSAVPGATSYKLEENLNTTGWVEQTPRPTGLQWSPPTPKTVSGTYAYRVSACNEVGCGMYQVGGVATVTLPTTVSVPTGLQVCRTGLGIKPCAPAGTPLMLDQTNATSQNFRVSWNAAQNATAYEYERIRRTACGGVGETSAPSAIWNTWIDGGAPNNSDVCGWVEFEYKVRGCAGTNCSAWTNPSVVVRIHDAVPRLLLETTYVHTDGLRSPVAETDASGTVTARIRHEPYGAVYGSTGTGQIQGPGYTGHVVDLATGLSYMQQRYYDPIAGRFLSTDPVAAGAASFNRYWYAANNPYKNIDSDGRYESPAWLLATVPGQGSFDNAMTSIENGNYGQAAMYGGAMVAEQVLSVATLGQGQAASTVGRTAAAGEGAAIKAAAGKADEAVELTAGQAKNLQRFESKLPSANTGTKVDKLGDGVSFTSEVPGKVPGSKAVYQKTVDSAGNTTSYMKTTIDPKGDIVHIKDKINNILLDKK